MARVMIVGLDGATFDIIHPLVRRGRLPALAHLISQGAHGVLRSSIPPVTPAAWTSFFTGKNPGKHGIYDFQALDYEKYSFSTVRTDLHREKTLWQLLGEAGLRSIVWDVPFTYPPRPLEGWMLTGYGTPRTEGTVFSYPKDLAAQVPADLRPQVRIAQPKVRFDRSRGFIDDWRSIMDGRQKLLNWLVREQDWDLFTVVFSITDGMAHVFWTYADPNHPNYLKPEAAEYREAFYEAYESCDRILGELIEAAGPDTTTLVISDHGFGSVRPRQYIFQRLMAAGYVSPRRKGSMSPGARLARLATDTYMRFPFLREWVKGLGQGSRRALIRSLDRAGVTPSAESIDFARSKIIPTNFGLRMWVNDSGRFPSGTVDPGQLAAVMSELEAHLLADRDPVNGRPILAAVHRGTDLYHGDYAHLGPDLVIEYANHFDFEADPLGDNPYTEGGHTVEGILLAHGGPVRAAELGEASLVDLAPSVLHLLDQPIPPDMDGRVLAAALDPAFLAANPVRMSDRPARNEGAGSGDGYTEEEEAELLEQLRKLGYV